MPGPQDDHLLLGALNLDAVGFDGGIILEGIVNDAAVECVEGLQLDDVPPAPDLFGCGQRLLHQSVPGLGAVAPMSTVTLGAEGSCWKSIRLAMYCTSLKV